MNNFYTEICNAKELHEEKAICIKYDKDFKKVRKCINIAMKQHMMSSLTSTKDFHELIINHLNQNKL